MIMNHQQKRLGDRLWDLWCLASIVGIWPRFVEPRMLRTTALRLPIKGLAAGLAGSTIAQFSDLHLNAATPAVLLDKLRRQLIRAQPDMIVFTGDALCFATLSDGDLLHAFFSSLPRAPLGNYAILGNHDYAAFIAMNSNGDYDTQREADGSLIVRGFKRLFASTAINQVVTAAAATTPPHPDWIALLADTPFELLNNETVTVEKGGALLNVCGFGEYMAGQMDLERAYAGYDASAAGILLLHNPDGIPFLRGRPGEVVLSGHTHAGQVNLPLLWKRFTLLENPIFKKGLVRYDERWVYINRGLGATLPFRWFAPPELLLLTLEEERAP